MHRIYLSLGSNLGKRQENIESAINHLKKENIFIDKVSSFYETEPIGYKKQNNFYNVVVRGKTEFKPEELLEKIKEIEKKLGRQKTRRFGPRKIDIDILLYDNIKLSSKNLTIPHPEMKNRRFVLEPLQEIASRLKIDGKNIKDILKNIKGQKVERIKNEDNK